MSSDPHLTEEQKETRGRLYAGHENVQRYRCALDRLHEALRQLESTVMYLDPRYPQRQRVHDLWAEAMEVYHDLGLAGAAQGRPPQ